MRVGIGYDVHRLDAEACQGPYTLMLCGLAFSAPHPVIAHSDGDVALHAIVDAILGAAALGDIGFYFPPSDQRWADCDSKHFVREACKMALEERKMMVSNIDVTICANPKKVVDFRNRREEMISSLADVLQIPTTAVNIKGKSGNEVSDDIGQGRAVAAQSVVLLKPLKD